jgi:hypothetical protein
MSDVDLLFLEGASSLDPAEPKRVQIDGSTSQRPEDGRYKSDLVQFYHSLPTSSYSKAMFEAEISDRIDTHFLADEKVEASAATALH